MDEGEKNMGEFLADFKVFVRNMLLLFMRPGTEQVLGASRMSVERARGFTSNIAKTDAKREEPLTV